MLRLSFNDRLVKLLIPEPMRITRSNWCTDRYSKGGYPYLSMESSASDFEEIAKPLPYGTNNPQIFFAGDAATIDSQWSTVKVAWKSGRRAADRIGGRVLNEP